MSMRQLYVLCLGVVFRSVALPLFIWDVDNSAEIETPDPILRGDRGLPITQYNRGNNGNATNIYGGKGRMPHFHGEQMINGGLPQHGNLSEHLSYFERDLAALIPEIDYIGICLLDYEHWRADWNSTPSAYRTKSIEAAGGDVSRARAEYEEGAKRFMLATINATRVLRPGCRITWYGYPRNALPFIPSVSYSNWCTWPQNQGACFFQGYATPSGVAQRGLNDDLMWLFEALDVVTPSIYLGILPDQTASEHSEEYVNSTIEEAKRLATQAGGKLVVPIAWYMTNNYWQEPAPAPREFLNLADARIEFALPFYVGADALLIWGSVDDVHTAPMLQQWVNSTLSVVVAEVVASRGTAPTLTLTTSSGPKQQTCIRLSQSASARLQAAGYMPMPCVDA